MKNWKLFGLKKLVPISELNIELISLHIPKTGGTSFRSLLNRNYGKRNVAQFDIVFRDAPKIKIDNKEVSEALLPAGTKVLHGHFEYWRLIEMYPNLKEVPVVTWVRDPVQRVISNYYYLLGILKKASSNSKLPPTLMNRLIYSLEEFSSKPAEKNKMSKHLKGLDIHSAYFVGVIENYDEDVLKLGKKLNWKHLHQEVANRTQNKESSIEEAVIKLIQSNNELDVKLYKEIIQLVK